VLDGSDRRENSGTGEVMEILLRGVGVIANLGSHSNLPEHRQVRRPLALAIAAVGIAASLLSADAYAVYGYRTPKSSASAYIRKTGGDRLPNMRMHSSTVGQPRISLPTSSLSRPYSNNVMPTALAGFYPALSNRLPAQAPLPLNYSTMRRPSPQAGWGGTTPQPQAWRR
jgi:hypothetical protein